MPGTAKKGDSTTLFLTINTKKHCRRHHRRNEHGVIAASGVHSDIDPEGKLQIYRQLELRLPTSSTTKQAIPCVPTALAPDTHATRHARHLTHMPPDTHANRHARHLTRMPPDTHAT